MMQQRKCKIAYGAILALVDVALLGASYYGAYWMRFYTPWFRITPLSYTLDTAYVWHSVLFVLFALAVMFAFQLYRWDHVFSGPGYYAKTILSVLVATLAIMVLGRFVLINIFSRIFLALLFALSAVVLTSAKLAIGAVTKKMIAGQACPAKKMVLGFRENMAAFKQYPPRTQKALYGTALALIDAAVLAASFSLAYWLRFYTGFFRTVIISYTLDRGYMLMGGLFVFFAMVLLAGFRAYHWDSAYRGPGYYIKLASSVVLATAVMVAFNYLFMATPVANLFLLMLLLAGIFLMLAVRACLGLATKKISGFLGRSSWDIKVGFFENMVEFQYYSRKLKKIVYGFMLGINDVIFLALSFYFAYWLRFYTRLFDEVIFSYTLDVHYVFYSFLFTISALIIFSVLKLYNWDSIYKGSGYYGRIIKGIFINLVAVIVLGALFEQFTFSRIWLALLLAISAALLVASRFFLEIMTQVLLKKLQISSKTAIIGIGENGKRMEHTFNKPSLWGYRIVGYIDSSQRLAQNSQYARAFNIIGHLENLEQVVKEHNIQRVIISGSEYQYFEILDILEQLKGMPVSIVLFPGFFEFSIKRVETREVCGIPLMQIRNTGFFGINMFYKNVTDYVLGSLMFLAFIPIYLVAGLAIKLDSPGPVFYKQKRFTKDCREFYMYKFRTMFADADKRLEELKQYNEADGPIFKIKNDPRITRVGRLLRKFSIDELPQIINVLKGELSLVGPRPPIPEEVAQYEDWVKKRLKVKQGVTGLWQISGRSELNFEEMARLDLYYIQNWSIGMDLSIILKTIPAIVFSKGAY